MGTQLLRRGRVTLVRALAPHVRQIRVEAADSLVSAVAAGEVSVRLAGVEGPCERRYSVWRTEGVAFDLAVVLHGGGPGAVWAAQVSVGDVVDYRPSRPPIALDPAAARHLFLSDETGVASAQALARAAPAGVLVRCVHEITNDGVRWSDAFLTDPRHVAWIVREGRPGAALGAQLGAARAADYVPPGTAVYVTGEAWLCATLARFVVRAWGVPSERVRALPYWKLRPRSPTADSPSVGLRNRTTW
jgi:NADPH-dependent ferric siderophore reductase